MNRIQKLRILLDREDKKRLLLLLIPMIFTSILNVIGIGVVMPFITVAQNPEAVFQNHKMAFFYHFFGFQHAISFVVLLGVLSFIFLVASNSAAAYTIWASTRIANATRTKITQKIYSLYLHSHYEYYLKNNTSNLTNNLIGMTDTFTQAYLIQGLLMITNIILVGFILFLIVIADPKVAALAFLMFGAGYFLIYIYTRLKLKSAGEFLVSNSQLLFKLISESFGGIKDVKLKGYEKTFINRSAQLLLSITDSRCSLQLAQSMPKYFVEVLAFGGIILMTLFFCIRHSQDSLGMLSLYAYAGYRLMPALQIIYVSLASFKGASGALDSVYASIAESVQAPNPLASFSRVGHVSKLSFREQLSFQDLSYRYPGHDRRVLDDVNITVGYNEMVGIIGSTGAGKTTLVDVFLGLLVPTKGRLLLDDVVLDDPEKIKAWQKGLGYVPQFIFLADCSIRENIAFGLPLEEIDQKRVERVAKIAAIHDFVVGELAEGYDTLVGERGIRLSGGQIQRIGIARALYLEPTVLVLDEATSSLDVKTEGEVMKAIYNMREKITIIIIAHRLSTVRGCDRVYLLEKGRVIDQGIAHEVGQRNQLTSLMS